MLILSRKVGERIMIADDIMIVVKAIQGDRIKVGVQAPKLLRVLRGELLNTPPKVNQITPAAAVEAG